MRDNRKGPDMIQVDEDPFAYFIFDENVAEAPCMIHDPARPIVLMYGNAHMIPSKKTFVGRYMTRKSAIARIRKILA